MTTQEFLTLLETNPQKELLFEYQSGQIVPKAYHITEVKNTHVDSVDCGGNEHSYDETIVQLWLSGTEIKTTAMSAEKALKIFNIVDGKRPLKRDTEIFFEYGNSSLPTSNYKVATIGNTDDSIVIKLLSPKAACKPKLSLTTVKQVVGKKVGCC